MWEHRVVVPPPGREHLLVELHEGHPGISRMKSLAGSIVWWPGMDGEIQEMVEHCVICQQAHPTPPAAPLQSWQWPTWPWSQLHIDFAGPLEGRMFLVIIDAHSKWMEVIPMKTATPFTTIEELRWVLAKFGISEFIVSDNGPQFIATKFEQFCQKNGIRHNLFILLHIIQPLMGLLKKQYRFSSKLLRSSPPAAFSTGFPNSCCSIG